MVIKCTVELFIKKQTENGLKKMNKDVKLEAVGKISARAIEREINEALKLEAEEMQSETMRAGAKKSMKRRAV